MVLEPFAQEKDLQVETPARYVRVEVGEVRILVHHLVVWLPAQLFAEQRGDRGFSRPDVAADGDEPLHVPTSPLLLIVACQVHALQDFFQVFLCENVDLVRVHGQQCRLIVLGKKSRVLIAEPVEIPRLDGALKRAVPVGDAVQQRLKVRREADHQRRPHRHRGDQAEQTSVQIQFLGVEIHLGKEAVFGKHVVADDRLPLLPRPADNLLLAVPAEKEEDLCLEGVAPHVLIEVVEKRILLHDFQHRRRAKRRSQQPGQRCLPNADRSLHRDEYAPHRSPIRQQRPLPGPGRPVHHARTHHPPATFCTSWLRTSGKNAASRRPSGNAASGAISSRGSSTKRRRVISGCGITKVGASTCTPSYNRMSISTVRRTHRSVLTPPSGRSTASASSSRSWGSRSVCTSATRFTNRGWSVTPTGAVS